jgi:hypothetical protein
MDRRSFLASTLGAVAAAAHLHAQAEATQISPAATPRDWTGQTPVRYPDPDIIRPLAAIQTVHRR